MIKICISVTSHALDPLAPLCHKLSHLLGPPLPLERDVLYGRPLIILFTSIGRPNYNFAIGVSELLLYHY